MNKCVFFDRDGIVNQSPGPGYVESWSEFILMDDFVKSLKIAVDRGYKAVIITNQRGVALGITPLEIINDIHSRLQNQLKTEHGLELLDIFFCPHEKDTCDCRKPLPGMILAASQKHDIDTTRSWMIGDNEKDVQCGHAAGCRTILVSSSTEDTAADFRVTSMLELPALLEELLKTDDS